MTEGPALPVSTLPPMPVPPPARPARPHRASSREFTRRLREVRTLGTEVERAVSGLRDPWRRTLAAPLGPGRAERDPDTRKPRAMVLHTAHPFLFAEAFPEVACETARDLAVSDRLLTEHLLHCDRTLDRPAEVYPGLLFLAQAEQAAGLRSLYRLFPPGNPFWEFFFQCHRETWRSVQEEWLTQMRGQGPESLSHCLRLARGKTALLKACTVGLPFLAGRPEERTWVSEALDHHHAGLVLLDDLEDWKEDFLRGNHTFLLTRVLHRAGLWDRVEREVPVPLHRVGDLLYRSGEAERHLRRAETCFRHASKAGGPVPLPLWDAVNRSYLHRCRSARKGIASWRRRSAAAAPGPAGRGVKRGRAMNPVRLFLRPGVPDRVRGYAARVCERFQAHFPACTPQGLTLGHWDGLPAHFCLPGRHPVNCAVNLLPATFAPPTTVFHNPLRLELVLALVTGARFLLHGPRRNLLEQLFVRGLGLEICKRLWPQKRESTWIRMSSLDRRWCTDHEFYLWERLAPFLQAPPPTGGLPVPGAQPPDPLTPGPASEGLRLFLGARFHAYVSSRNLNPDPGSTIGLRPGSLVEVLRRYLTR